MKINRDLYEVLLAPTKVDRDAEDFLDAELTDLWTEIASNQKDKRSFKMVQHHILTKLTQGMEKMFYDWRLKYNKQITSEEQEAKRIAIEKAEAVRSLLGGLGKEMWARASGKVDAMNEMSPELDQLREKVEQQQAESEAKEAELRQQIEQQQAEYQAKEAELRQQIEQQENGMKNAEGAVEREGMLDDQLQAALTKVNELQNEVDRLLLVEVELLELKELTDGNAEMHSIYDEIHDEAQGHLDRFEASAEEPLALVQLRESHANELEKQREDYMHMKDLRLQEASRYKTEAYDMVEEHHAQLDEMNAKIEAAPSVDRYKQMILELDGATRAIAELEAKHAAELAKVVQNENGEKLKAKVVQNEDGEKLKVAYEKIAEYETTFNQMQLRCSALEAKHAETVLQLECSIFEAKHAETVLQLQQKDADSATVQSSQMQDVSDLALSYEAQMDVLMKQAGAMEEERMGMARQNEYLSAELAGEKMQNESWQAEREALSSLKIEKSRLETQLEIYMSPTRIVELDDHTRALRMAADAVACCERAESELKEVVGLHTARISELEQELSSNKSEREQEHARGVLNEARAERLEQELSQLTGRSSQAVMSPDPTKVEQAADIKPTPTLQQQYDQNVLKLELLRRQLKPQLDERATLAVGDETLAAVEYPVANLSPAAAPDQNAQGDIKNQTDSVQVKALDPPVVSPSRTLLLQMTHADSAAQLEGMKNQLKGMHDGDALDQHNATNTEKLIQLTARMSNKFSPAKTLEVHRQAVVTHSKESKLKTNADAARLAALTQQLSNMRNEVTHAVSTPAPWARLRREP